MTERPFGVSLLTILIVIYGISAVITGLLGLFSIFGDLGTGLLIASIFAIILGLIYLAVAKGLWNGSSGARMIVTIITVIALIVGIFNLFSSQTLWYGIWSIVVSLIVLYLLFNARAKAFFA